MGCRDYPLTTKRSPPGSRYLSGIPQSVGPQPHDEEIPPDDDHQWTPRADRRGRPTSPHRFRPDEARRRSGRATVETVQRHLRRGAAIPPGAVEPVEPCACT
jgi:hypothetical protein